VPEPAAPETTQPRWGLGEVFGGWALVMVASTTVSAIVLGAIGYQQGDTIPLALTALLQLPLWAGLLFVPWWATRTKGAGLVRDLGARMRLVDIPLGVAAGLACQLLAIPALYWVLFRFIGEQDVSAEARELTDRATSPLGVVLLMLIVGLGAPVAEELFFRGLTQRALEKRGLSWGVAVTATALFFAATHLQPLQFPALFLFGLVLGWLVRLTGRLGPALWAHVAFNLSAAAVLVWDLGIS
jgi:membrane protease YdiL (CAAX protease family)